MSSYRSIILQRLQIIYERVVLVVSRYLLALWNYFQTVWKYVKTVLWMYESLCSSRIARSTGDRGKIPCLLIRCHFHFWKPLFSHRLILSFAGLCVQNHPCPYRSMSWLALLAFYAIHRKKFLYEIGKFYFMIISLFIIVFK